MTALQFRLRERIIGAAKQSLILRGDNGEVLFCSNTLFNKLMTNPNIAIAITTLGDHMTLDKCGNEHYYPESKWLVGFIPTRF